MSTPERPIIAFDCDGVILDFTKGFHQWYYQNQHQHTYGDISPSPTQWNFNWSGDQTIIQKLVANYIAERPVLELILPDCGQLLSAVKKRYPVHVHIVTHFYDREGRLNNLIRQGLIEGQHYDELYCATTARDKIKRILELRPLYYVEDAPHIIRLLLDHNIDWSLTICVPCQHPYSNDLPQPNPEQHPNVKIQRYQCSDSLLKLFSNLESPCA